MADQKKRMFRIFQDEVKLRHTTHWDLDTMSRSELDAYMKNEGRQLCGNACATQSQSQHAVAEPENAWSRFIKALLPAR